MGITSLINGKPERSISVDNRGLAYGDGVFETIKVVTGTPVFLELHLKRLRWGCQRLSIECDYQLLQQEIKELLAASASAQSILKIVITRAACGRGYNPNTRVGDRILTLQEQEAGYSAQQRQGVKLHLCSTRLGINPVLAGIKHLCRLENVLARAEWSDPSIFEGLMLDVDGSLVEGTMSNVFLVKSGELLTPALDRCGVEGVVRQVIINTLSVKLGMTCTIKRLTVDDIYSADELFICNSLIGICSVSAVGCHLKTMNDSTRKLHKALEEETRHCV